MKNKLWRKEFAVGLMVIVGIVLLSILLITATNWSRGGFDMKIRFDYVGGLIGNAPVHIYGVEVGKVKSVDLVEDYVQVTAHIRKNVRIREGYEVHIDILGVVGEKYLEIINGPAKTLRLMMIP